MTDLKIDLHMHSAASDGALSPMELMEFVRNERGLDVVALTDHDTMDGVAEARAMALRLGMQFVGGVEFSCSWSDWCIHVVGLNMDENDAQLKRQLADVCLKRDERAHRIAERFEALGLPGMFESALRRAPNKLNISRTHFARVLLDHGVVGSLQEAFERYLKPGGPAYVPAAWPALDFIVREIRLKGGIPVLAHPGRYPFTQDWMREQLAADFAAVGGMAVEVVSGSQRPEFIPMCMNWVERYGFVASSGSDFHSFSGTRPVPGSQGTLPKGVPTVLDLLGIC